MHSLVKVCVVQRILSCDSLLRVECQHFHHEVQAGLVHFRESLSEILTRMLMEADQRKVRKLRYSGPVLLSRSAHPSEDRINCGYLTFILLMTYFVIALATEQRFALHHMGEYASDGPNVDGCAVIFLAEEEFWCTVPYCNHLLCPWLSGQVEDTGKPEVDDLQNLILVEQDIRRRYIPVEDSSLVTVINCAQNLPHK